MNNKKGFTLLEVLIALAIVSGILVTIIFTVNYHLTLLEKHEIITRATLLAEKMLHEYKAIEATVDIEEEQFKSLDDDYQYKIIKRETGLPGIIFLDVAVRKDKEVVILRRLLRK